MNGSVLSTLGLALRGGNLVMGETPVTEACRRRRARLVLMAEDTAENTARRFERIAADAGVRPVRLPCSKELLGGALGRRVCAVAAVTDEGLAALLQKKLAALEVN